MSWGYSYYAGHSLGQHASYLKGFSSYFQILTIPKSPKQKISGFSFHQMDFLFGRRKTPEEMLRQNQRALNRAMRELDRERMKLEQQEKKIIADIKKMAKQGQMVRFEVASMSGGESGRWFMSACRLQDAVKIMAKDLVRTRRYVKKFIMMKANIQAVSLKIQTLKSNNSMAQAMKGVTKAMATMNRQVCVTVTVWALATTLWCWPLRLSAAEAASDSEDHDGVWATERNHGHEGGDDERRHRWRHGRRRRRGRKVIKSCCSTPVTLYTMCVIITSGTKKLNPASYICVWVQWRHRVPGAGRAGFEFDRWTVK